MTVRIDWDGPNEEPLKVYGAFDADDTLWSVTVYEVHTLAGLRVRTRRPDLEVTLAEDPDVRLALADKYRDTLEAMAEDEMDRRNEDAT